jgi:subtilisin family serine protease
MLLRALLFLALALLALPARAASPAPPTARFLVELATPAVVDRVQETGRAGLARPVPSARLDVESPAARAAFAQVAAEQAQVIERIQARLPGVQVERQYALLLNALAVRAPATAAPKLASVPGVQAVSPDRPYRLLNAPDVEQIGAPALWRQIGQGPRDAGAGVKVAIIDSGIYTPHPSFHPAGYEYPPGFPKGDTRFTTPKVIAARVYLRPNDPPQPGEDTPQPGPRADSHGTHVAAIVAGNAGVIATVEGVQVEISGVAPGAYLMNYRVFYPSQSESDFVSGNAFTVELIAALEDAVRDGADVINNSWGSSYQATLTWPDPMARAAAAAVRAGVVVVNAVGNAGPALATANSPASAPGVISVGAVTTSREIAPRVVRVLAPAPVPADLATVAYGWSTLGPRLNAPTAPLPVMPVQADDPRSACDPLPAGSLSGAVALVLRGTCPFIEKARHVQEAGAAAMLVINTSEELLDGFGGQGQEISIPVGLVTRSAGQRLLNWVQQHGTEVRLRLEPRPSAVASAPNVLASFSSRGPSLDGTLAPDVVAPGVNIVSAGYGSGANPLAGFGQVSGTSMAAPHVAGAAALLRQAHPEWSPLQVRAALMLTADRAVWEVDGTLAGPLARGAGRVDVAAAAATPLLADPPSLALGALQAGPVLTRTLRLQVLAAGDYQVGYQPAGVPLALTVDPVAFSARAGDVVDLRLTLETRGLTPGEYGGDLVIAGPRPLHLPIWLRVVPARDRAVLLLDNDGSEDGGLPNTVAVYRAALDALAIPYDLFDADEPRRPGQVGVPPLGALARYRVVILLTGSRDSPVLRGRLSLTQQDQDVLSDYLNGGGALLLAGANTAAATDTNRAMRDPLFGRSRLFHGYFGAVVRGMAPLPREVRGAPGTPLAGQRFALSGEGEAPLLDVYREDSDTYLAPETVHPLLEGERGTFGLLRVSDLTSPEGRPKFAYRSAVLAFGLEAVSPSDRAALLGPLVRWLMNGS